MSSRVVLTDVLCSSTGRGLSHTSLQRGVLSALNSANRFNGNNILDSSRWTFVSFRDSWFV